MQRLWKAYGWIPLAVFGAAMIVLGLFRNEATPLFSLASTVCPACIGIG